MRTSVLVIGRLGTDPLHRALEAGNGRAAYAAGRRAARVELADALKLTPLLADQRERFERLAARWVGPLRIGDARGPTRSRHLVLSALATVGLATQPERRRSEISARN